MPWRRLAQWLRISVWLLAVGALTACGLHYDVPPARERALWPEHRPLPRYYRVVQGDTMYAIAWRYRLDYKALARWNEIPPPFVIQPDQRLRLRRPPWMPERAAARAGGQSTTLPPRQAAGQPRSASETPGRSAQSARASQVSSTPRPAATPTAPTSRNPEPPSNSAGSASRRNTDPSQVSASGWSWPVAGRVLRAYGASGASRRGMDLGGEVGSPVRASRGGEVVYSGNGLVGYGELIIIKHDDRYLSAYGFNQSRLVAEGEAVNAGQVIARMGTGPDNQAMLHFEVRDRGKPIDPIRVLPDR